MKTESGSALTETVFLVVVMVPLMIGVPMIGKLIDLKQTTEQAGRYAAWEATVYPQANVRGRAPSGLVERFFGDESNGLQSMSQEPGVHSLWGDTEQANNAGWLARTAVRINDSSVAGSRYLHDSLAPSLAMSVSSTAADSGTILEDIHGNSWGLTGNGIVQASVSVAVRENEWLGAESGKCGGASTFNCLSASSVIFADGWSAGSDQQARQRVRSLMPASALEPLGNAVARVGHLPMFKELKKLDGAFGHVDMSVLPDYARP